MSIEVRNVTHIYSKGTPFEFLGLDHATLSIHEGAITAIIGHTGSGKSTLIQHLNALLTPTEGEVQVKDYLITADKKPTELKNLRKLVGLVFQFPEYQLFEETIEKDIIFGPTNFGMDEEEAKQRAKEVIKLVGLDESYLEKSPFDLSGGQKRRIAIAGILIMNPDILVLDEPTAGLDPQGAIDMMNIFKRLNQQGKTIILVTHDMNHVLNYCQYAIVMDHGKLQRNSTVGDLFMDPEYVKSMSIDLPTITDFIYELDKRGFDIPLDVHDVDDLVIRIGGQLNG